MFVRPISAFFKNPRGRKWRLVVGTVILTMFAVFLAPVGSAQADPCGPGSNPVACENSLPGTPMSQWYAPGAYGDIQGFSTTESVAPGGTISFKVDSPEVYQVEIYRLGWYGGDGARLMPTSPTTIFPAITQPACNHDSSTGMTDCGNWSVTASWTAPSNAVSGVYLAELDETSGHGFMPYPFVVTNLSSHSDLVVQTSDQTWQAYNMFGGADLYQGNGPAPDGRAYSVSYNRPLNVSGSNGIFGSEYPMIQFLERNGYDVSYLSGVDVSTQGSLLLNHKTFISSGHDEYWNQNQWNAVMAARNAGVNLAFFAGNDVFWKTQLQPSIVDNAANRTLDCYKMTKMEFPQPDGIADPSGQWTGTWMDPAGAGIGGNMPQNQLTGTLFDVNGYNAEAITVSPPYSTDRLWRNTSVASLQAGQTYTMQTGTLGYEWDSDVLNSVRPQGEIDMSSTSVNLTNGTLLKDNGNVYGNGTAVHSMTLYKASSGALVFSSGTVQWAWGLGTTHYDLATNEDPVQEQATINLLADMGSQPMTLMSGLVQATKSADTTGPNTNVTTPTSGSTVPAMSPVTISGTATDSGSGVVARVEVSVDGGSTWTPATGLGSWTYSWTPTAQGSVNVLVRAEDDSANVGNTVTIPLTVGPQQCPCSIFPNSATPAKPDSGDGTAVNVGVKFATSASGAVTGVRFYKTATNTGTHVGSLWTSTGTLLGSVTFTNETASGWQTALFSQPIPVSTNTTYVVSELDPSGHYSADANYFANQGAGLAPITALQSNSTSANGVYKYGTSTTFPSNGYQNTNYYVDAVFQSNITSTTPPTVTSTLPTSNATGVPVNTQITASLSEGIQASTLKFTLTGPGGAAQGGSATYDPVGHVVTFLPNGQLALNTTYTATVSATDLWGNAMTSPYTWSFTTSPTPPAYTCPCSIFGGNGTPANPNVADHSVEVGVRFQSAAAGYVTGVSFYKGLKNTGTHTGSLWTNSGTLLATGTFTGESASGWQTLTFSSPVAISANTPYIASMHDPNGYYAVTEPYFNSAVTNYPLTALQSVSGSGNGLYTYESGSTAAPSSTFNASNYWVDVNFTTSTSGSGGGSAPASATSNGSMIPATNNTADKDDIVTTTTGVSDAVHPPSVTFAKGIQPQSLHITVTTTEGMLGTESPAGTAITGTLLYSPATQTAAFEPNAPLRPGAIYKAVATATGLDGKAITPISWTFRELVPGSAAPHRLPGQVPGGSVPSVVALATENDSWRRTDPLPPTDV